MRRAIRRSLAGAAALAAVAAVIAVPHLAGRAEPAPPPTAPPIPGAPLPTPAAAPADGEPAAEPAPPPLQRLVPPSQGALLGVSNPDLPREAGAVDELDGRARGPPAHRELVPAVAQRRDPLPRRLGDPRRRAGRGPHDHVGALVGPGGRAARGGAARGEPGAHRRRRPRPPRPLLRAPGRRLPRPRAPALHARDERPAGSPGARTSTATRRPTSSPRGGTSTASSATRAPAT